MTSILLNAGLLILCFVVLVKGADVLVDGASDIAKALRIPSVIIGLTIVAFGTSAPEAGVSITSSVLGMDKLSISNVVGSNTFNLLVVVGLCAAIRGFAVDEEIRKRDYPLCILFSALLIFFVRDLKITRIEGIILFALVVSYVILLIVLSVKASSLKSDEDNAKVSGKRVVLSLLKVVLSVVCIYLSSRGIVKSCSFFAKLLGVSDTIIGLTIVAFGTSLPELATSVVASRKGENGIALGNVVGSNIFNILFVLGVSSFINPIGNLSKGNLVDTIICLGITAFCGIFVFAFKKFKRIDGIIMLLIYAAYMAFVFMREFGVIIL
ncbi:MAG: calcium/sodium antiporter [Clostridiales bacterium]|nr:calcium/sodium antiporter [Clostridiales bacterium]